MLDPIVDSWRVQLGVTLIIGHISKDVGYTDFPRRIVYISDELTRPEMRCTAMHEFGHVAIGAPEATVDPDSYEDAADEWAAQRLVSRAQYEQALKLGRDDRDCALICDVDPNIWHVCVRLYGDPPEPVRYVRAV